MKTMKKMLAFLMAVCMTLAMTVPAMADNTAVQESRKGVLQVVIEVTVDDVYWGYLQCGTGFLIGEGAAQHVITSWHVAHVITENDVRELLGAGGANANIDLQVAVAVKGDVRIEASILNESQQYDFSILELSQAINNRTPLSLGDSSQLTSTQEVFALGFPSIVATTKNADINTFEDVTVTSGIVSKLAEVQLPTALQAGLDGTSPCIVHSARISEGNSGGPLVNAEGVVVGINALSSNDVDTNNTDYFYATQINEIKDVLDALGINYISSNVQVSNTTDSDEDVDVTEEPTEEPVVEVDKSALQDKIDEANTLDGSKYSVESWGVLENNLEAAKDVLEDEAVSQDMVDKKADALAEAINQLEEKSGISMTMIAVIAAIIIVIIVLVVVLVVVSSSGKKKTIQPIPSGPIAGMPNPTPVNNGAAYNPNPYNGPATNYQTASNEGAGETSVLSEGAGETTVLGGGAAGSAYLIRTKTGEKITINSPNFTIGKEKRRVNYCISDNSSVSRSHARITRRGTQYFITDMNSTNFTFVNGTKATPNMDMPLEDAAKIRLSDEDFEFHLS